ncbi:DgyrCDS12324 [Dimorphilus gyrociliatus]|uniref:DgyrCDS12324 n=1 Tax=Dimorphilus gyrociliatus TaxID=2664684 RepID=A0A7I8W825_9ANNE|nr:DgyrCDS12324 [Dimorphilus gyrociliatus]
MVVKYKQNYIGLCIKGKKGIEKGRKDIIIDFKSSSVPSTPTNHSNFTSNNEERVASTKLKKSSSFSGTSCSNFTKNDRPTVSSIDRDAFLKCFEEDFIPVKIVNVKDMQDRMFQIKLTLASPHIDWEKRCSTLKEIRSLIANGATRYDEFFSCLRLLEPSMQVTLKDLRSQVVRETCITLAYLSVKLRSKFDHFTEIILSYLFALIPNAVKVMSSSACTCISFLLENSRNSNVLSSLLKQLKSKSNVIRREGYDFIALVLTKWSTRYLEKNADAIQECIVAGLSDADSDARAHARRGFWAYADHFPNKAEQLRRSLDFSKQKLLQGKINGVVTKVASSIRTRSQSADRSKSKDISHSAKVDTPQRPRQATCKNLKVKRFVQDNFEPESDDAHSESSSLYSNTSFSSHGSRSEDLLHVIKNLDNSLWMDKREGLLSLKSLLLNGRKLNFEELKQIMECIVRTLHEQHAKLFSSLLDVIPELISTHSNMSNWLYILLVRLLLRGGSSDVLGSLQIKLWKCLQVIRDTFDPSEQIQCLAKIIIEPSLSLSLKVKETISTYAIEVVKRIDGEIMEKLLKDNGIRLAVSKIIMWTSEPKSGELRTASCKLIVALFDCNPPAFQSILSSMPHSFRQKTTAVLKTFVKRATGDEHKNSRFISPFPPPPPPVVDNGVNDIDIDQLLHNLSNYELENGKRMDHFRALLKVTTSGSIPEDEWDSFYSSILLLILDAVSGKEEEDNLKEIALKTLNELLQSDITKVGKYLDLTTKKILECKLSENSQGIKTVADKCLKTLMKMSDLPLLLISISSCITADLHELNVISLHALKDLIEKSSREQSMDALSSIASKVILAYYSPESSVRKCAVVALVALYMKVGDTILKNYLKDLAPAKLQLLELYIEKLSKKERN